jgi:hypothetical protein
MIGSDTLNRPGFREQKLQRVQHATADGRGTQRRFTERLWSKLWDIVVADDLRVLRRDLWDDACPQGSCNQRSPTSPDELGAVDHSNVSADPSVR